MGTQFGVSLAIFSTSHSSVQVQRINSTEELATSAHMLPQAQRRTNESWTHSVTIIIWSVGTLRTNTLGRFSDISWIDCVAHTALQFYCFSSQRSLRSWPHCIICSLWPPSLMESSQQASKQMLQLLFFKLIQWPISWHNTNKMQTYKLNKL